MDLHDIHKQVEELTRILGQEDALGCVIRSHIYLENALIEYVGTVAPYPDRLKRTRFSFNQWLDLALAHGLKAQYRAPLLRLNKLRNEFAHKLDTELTDEVVMDMYHTFSKDDRRIIRDNYRKLRESIVRDEDDFESLGAKDKLAQVVITLWAILRAAVTHADPDSDPERAGELTAFMQPLSVLYQDNNVIDRLNDNLEYLLAAHREIESFWEDNFKELDHCRLVLFSEAPLFGAARTYIYNPASPPTQFMYPSDLDLLLASPVRNKTDLLAALRQLGILFMDIFPYAFNNDQTPFGYRDLSLDSRMKLAAASRDLQLIPKLEKLRNLNPDVRFCARYAAVEEIARTVLPKPLAELGFRPSEFRVISKQGGGIDKEKLKQEYDAAMASSEQTQNQPP